MTTTEAPSVDGPTPDALSEQESRAMNRVLAWYGSMRGSHAQFYREVDDLRIAARAEAIRERDEAIGLLRRAEWGGMDMSGGAGSDKHCPSCLNSKETGHWEGCAVAAFLARFPEGGEG